MPRERKLPAGMRKRGSVYYAWFKRDGRAIRKRLSSDYKTAEVLLRDLMARADKGDFGLVDNDYSWATLKAEFLKWAKQAIRNPDEYERDLKHFEEFSKVHTVSQVDQQLVIAFRQWRLAQTKRNKRPITPRTVNREVATIRNMLNRGIQWGRIGYNPLAKMKALRHDAPTKERRSLSVAEVERLFAASPEFLRPVWRMFMTTGVRREELANMTFDDVDFDRGTITVQAATAKNHKAREIPLDDGMLATITRLWDEAKDRRPVPGLTAKATGQQAAAFTRRHVFTTKANTPWKSNLLSRFYACCKRAGIEDAHPGGAVDIHSLRVSFTTLALDHGANPKAIQSLLGHSTLSLTMSVYAKSTERSKRAAVAALPFASVKTPDHVVSMQEAHNRGTSSKSESEVKALSVVG